MIKVTYLHYNPFQYPKEKIEYLVVKGNDIQKAKKVYNRLQTLRKRKGINIYRLSSIKEVKTAIM